MGNWNAVAEPASMSSIEGKRSAIVSLETSDRGYYTSEAVQNLRAEQESTGGTAQASSGQPDAPASGA